MLSRPLNGWTDFSLGQEVYGLSYLTNVPIEWVNQAIHGLETLEPFAVHGVMEPDRMICLVILKELIVKKECYFGENRGFF